MAKNIIKVEAESVEEAREKAQSEIPEGFVILSETVISDGKPETIEVISETTRGAFFEARDKIPKDATVLEERELAARERRIVTVEALDERSATEVALSQVKHQLQFGDAAWVRRVDLTAAGSKGIFGIGKTPNQYEAEIIRRAVVEVTYKTKAEISVEIGPSEERQRELAQLVDMLVTELVQIGQSEGFITISPEKGICARCSAEVVRDDQMVRCARCGLTQNHDNFNDEHQHIRTREIGEILSEAGGIELMRTAAYRVRDILGSGPASWLNSCWRYIGGWLP